MSMNSTGIRLKNIFMLLILLIISAFAVDIKKDESNKPYNSDVKSVSFDNYAGLDLSTAIDKLSTVASALVGLAMEPKASLKEYELRFLQETETNQATEADADPSTKDNADSTSTGTNRGFWQKTIEG